jgi:hypothetical protein
VWRDNAGTLAKYGIAGDRASLFEDDDLIPVCLGGNGASPMNHRPQLTTDTFKHSGLRYRHFRKIVRGC